MFHLLYRYALVEMHFYFVKALQQKKTAMEQEQTMLKKQLEEANEKLTLAAANTAPVNAAASLPVNLTKKVSTCTVWATVLRKQIFTITTNVVF